VTLPGSLSIPVMLSGALALATVVHLVRRYGELPARIPVHFGLRGAPDGWGPKAFLWLCPAMSLMFFAVIVVGARLAGLPSSARPVALPCVLLATQATLFSLEVGWVRIAAGEANNIWPYVGPLLLVVTLLSVVGAWLSHP